MPRRHRTQVPQPTDQPIDETNEAVSDKQSTSQSSSQPVNSSITQSSKPASSKPAQSKPAASKAASTKPSQSTSQSSSQSPFASLGFDQAIQVGSKTLWVNKDLMKDNPEEVARMMDRAMKPGKSEFQLFCDANYDQIEREMGSGASPLEIMQVLGMRFNMKQMGKR